MQFYGTGIGELTDWKYKEQRWKWDLCSNVKSNGEQLSQTTDFSFVDLPIKNSI